MPDPNKFFRILNVATVTGLGPDGAPGVPIIAPMACSRVVIENMDGTNAQNVFADEVGTDFKVLPSTIELDMNFKSDGGPVVQQGERVCRVQAVSGAGPVRVTFYR